MTTVNGDEKTEKHAHGSDYRFGPCDPLLPRPCEHESPEGLGLKAFGLLTERVQERDECQTVVLEGSLGCAPMHPHPVLKGGQERGGRRWRSHWGRWRDQPCALQEVHEVACTHKKVAQATTGVVQSPEASQVLTKGLQGVSIKLRQR